MENKNEKEQSLKLRKRLLIFAVVAILVIPLLTQLLINWDTAAKGSDDGWLGFWGGYLGSIIGVVGAILVFHMQLSNETGARKEEQRKADEVRREEKVDNTFFNLLNLLNNQQDKLLTDNTFDKVLRTIEDQLQKTLSAEGIRYFYKEKDKIIKILKVMCDELNKLIELEMQTLTSGSRSYKIAQDMIKGNLEFITEYGKEGTSLRKIQAALHNIETIDRFATRIEKNQVSELNNASNKLDIINQLALMERISIEYSFETTQKSLSECLSNLSVYTKSEYNKLSDSGRKTSIEQALRHHYSELGGFLRLFHRIIKYINENTEKTAANPTKKNYIGFLRATLNQSEILVIFYNCIYSDKGIGLKQQLSNTTFFGDSEDFENTEEAPFVDKGKLYFKEDFDIMSNLNGSGSTGKKDQEEINKQKN